MRVLRFTAEWCGPCKKVAPVIDRLQQEHDDLQVLVYDVDTEEGREAANLYRISGVPTLLRVDPANGEEQARLVGAHPKGKIEKALGIC